MYVCICIYILLYTSQGFRLSGFQAFRLSGSQALRLLGFQGPKQTAEPAAAATDFMHPCHSMLICAIRLHPCHSMLIHAVYASMQFHASMPSVHPCVLASLSPRMHPQCRHARTHCKCNSPELSPWDPCRVRDARGPGARVPFYPDVANKYVYIIYRSYRVTLL